MSIFHLAFHVRDLASTRRFYIDILGCKEGRSTDTWLDFEFFGHQLSAHLGEAKAVHGRKGRVDGVDVPIPHFGSILSLDEFHRLAERMLHASVEFLIEPQVRYKGKTGEQWTMFVFDFSGNPLEFKAFLREEDVFSQ